MRRAWPLVVVVLAGCATFRALFRDERPHFIPAEAVYITGAQARAAGVAYGDWMAYRAETRATREAVEDAGDSGFVSNPDAHVAQLCFDRPDAYQTWVWPNDAGTSYFVYILRRDEACFPKEEGEETPYYGDFMTYEIDARTFEILKREVREE